MIGAQLARSSWAETAIAAAYSSGGRKTKKTTSGSSSGDGQARDEADHQPAEHERDRIRDAAAQAEARQHGDGEQQEDEQLDLGHGHHLSRVVPCLVDARGLRCPLPLIRARQALASLAPGETLVVLATDPEAPIDLAALASDVRGRAFSSERRRSGEWSV